MASPVRLLCAVPTRNRAHLAERAIDSLLAPGLHDVRVLVSDNSTDESERLSLQRACTARGLTPLRPPAALSMTEHWQWMLDSALEDGWATHVLFLTDRMVFRRGDLARLRAVAAAHPDRVVSYHEDTVHDDRSPVGLRLAPWTGRLLELESLTLLTAYARGMTPWAIPRMLNCIAPITALARVRERFGGVFGSISPDFCFGFRVLATEESLVYLDRAAMVAYGLQRSNGASYARGEQTRDRVDFAAQLGAMGMNASAPVPDVHTIRNAIFNEYCFVRQEAPDRLPPLDPRGYLAALLEDLTLLEDGAMRRQMIERLADPGWVGAPRRRLDAAVVAMRGVFAAWDLVRLAVRGTRRIVCRPPESVLWRTIGRQPPPALLGFSDSDAALAHAATHRGPRVETLDHLGPLIDGPVGPPRELSRPPG